MQDDPYKRLAAAIVEQAAQDYQEAMEYLYENPDGRKKMDCITEKLEDEGVFPGRLVPDALWNRRGEDDPAAEGERQSGSSGADREQKRKRVE